MSNTDVIKLLNKMLDTMVTKEEFYGLKQDVSTLKQDVSDIKIRVSVLEKKVDYNTQMIKGMSDAFRDLTESVVGRDEFYKEVTRTDRIERHLHLEPLTI